MFGAVFKALMRVFNNTLAPILMGFGVLMMELFMGAISWILVIMGNGVIAIVASLLSVVPAPAITLEEGTFGREFLEIADLAGVWPALALFFAGAAAAFVLRIITLGIVGK